MAGTKLSRSSLTRSPSSIKPNHIQEDLQLVPRASYPVATARLGRGRERVDKYELNTLVYDLKYIQTVDAAIGHSEDRWLAHAEWGSPSSGALDMPPKHKEH